MSIDLHTSTRAKKAMALFTDGYNCSQSVFLAFNDLVDIPFEDAARMSSSFGGGMGRLREVCGGLTGCFMATGYLYGYSVVGDDEEKAEHYERIQEMSRRFKKYAQSESFICRDLLDIDEEGADSPIPRARTEEYYEERPCERLVGVGAYVLEEYMQQYPANKK